MKNILLILAITFSTASFSQGNLQFNQVKLVTAVETVPAGKVWKLESCAYNGGAPFPSGSVQYAFLPPSLNATRGFDAIMSYSINGNSVNIPASYIIGTNTNVLGTNNISNFSFPLWLPAGTTLSAGTNMTYLSVIEFNVVP